MMRWNYRGLQKGTRVSTFGPDAYNYTASTTLVDLNASYRFRKHAVFFLSARNLFNQPRIEMIYGSETPFYAQQNRSREYGTQYTAGIKGKF